MGFLPFISTQHDSKDKLNTLSAVVKIKGGGGAVLPLLELVFSSVAVQIITKICDDEFPKPFYLLQYQ